MPSARPIPLVLLFALSACYAEFDVPRCERATDCPVGYTTCYDSYCLAMPVAGVQKAALPQVVVDGGGVTDAGGVSVPEVVWTMDPAALGGAITAEPAAAGDVLYVPVQAKGGALVAVLGGEVAFTESLAGASPRCPMVLGDEVVVPHDSGISWVAGDVGPVEQRTVFEWTSLDAPIAGCAAALPTGQVFVALASGQVVLLVDGVEKTRSKINPPPKPISSISLVSKSELVIATDSGSLILLDAQSLSEGAPLEVGHVASELAAWKDQVLLFSDVEGKTGLRLVTAGGLLVPQPPLVVPSPLAGHLVVVSGDRAAAALVDGTVRRFKVGPNVSLASSVAAGSPSLVTPVVVDDGALLVLDGGAGKLDALDANGELLFDPLSLDSGKLDAAGVVMADDLAVVYAGDGHLFAVRLPGVTGLSKSAPWPKRRGGAANLGAAPAARDL